MATLPSALQSIVAANSAIYQAPLTGNLIRIVQLYPGLDDEPILCSLTVVDLAKAESFEALSYCWGSVVSTRPIFCGGHPFSPTENLFAALKQLRLPSRVRCMWIDAICINQNSILERNQQVPLMRQIYHKAKQVVVWLGDEDDTTALALITMQNIFELCCLSWHSRARNEEWLMNLENDEEYWHSLRTDIVQKVSPQWPDEPRTCANALQTFFRRPWFSRVWVIQEVQGCSRITMQVGKSSVAWYVVASTATWVVYAPSPVTRINEPYKFGGFLHTDLMQQRLFTTKDDVPFLEVLDRCRAFKCTIDVDRIFALLQHPAARLLAAKNDQASLTQVFYPLSTNVALSASHFELKVDYNIPLFDLYRQVVLSSISKGRSLQVLNHTTEESKDREGYPKWMPVWHARGDSRHTGPRRTFLYNASREFEPQVRTFTNHMHLGVGGLVAGIVTQTSTNILFSTRKVPRVEVISLGTTLEETREISRLIVRDCWQPEENWLQEAICRTSSQPALHFEDFCAFVTERLKKTPGPTLLSLHGKWCDICMTRHVASPANGFDEVLEIWHCEICFDFDMCKECCRSGHTCPGQHELHLRAIPSMICHLDEQTRYVLEEHKGKGNSKRFDTSVKQTFDGKHFVKLDNGLLGVGPDTTCAGDLVVVLFGGRVPFILRQHGNYYILLGECYIHGIMDGEAIDGWREGRLEEKDFVLA
ncbi:heterokaryon incompatibility protein-domain-containing protein [Pyrenochaeta sp. MPI-SDFR-AT-0127]|nr:heterokaryon incompatibility protein-domain-containing protein [Pyrenochaeta sp. MPI-SDFR-AT-0127]